MRRHVSARTRSVSGGDEPQARRPRGRFGRLLFLAAPVLAAAVIAPLQPWASLASGPRGAGTDIAPSPKIVAMLGEVSSTRMQDDGAALVGFGTRHTLSSQDDP